MSNNSLAKRDLFDWLDDLCVRFIINLPLEELAEAERTCFQIEEAQWFYEDFIRPLDPDSLPVLNLRNFYMLICQHCPILCDYPAEQHAEAFERFLQYKTRVPVRGAIMLNEAMDEVVLVKGWKKNANWSFPRGKINKEEPDLTCAVREVYEETGYDLEAAGLVGDGENMKAIEIAMREQSLKLFVFRGVPMDTHFEPRTRKEISKIQWYKLSELPSIKKKGQQQEEKGEALANNANKFYMVAPFLGHLKKWIAQQRKLDKANPAHRSTVQHQIEVSAATDVEEAHTEAGTGTRGDIDKLLDAHRKRKQHKTATQYQTEETVSTDAEAHQPETEFSTIGDIGKLLDAHQQRKQRGVQRKPKQAPSDLPEVSSTTVKSEIDPPKMHIDVPQNTDRLNKIDLLAILKGTKTLSQEPPPQTPAAQMIDEPVMPHSPPHHHLSRMPTLPLAPTVAGTSFDPRSAENNPRHVPQSESASSRGEPEKAAPKDWQPDYNNASTFKNERLPILAPYQRTDPKFAAANTELGNQGPAIPPASNLPKPILTQQKASLLSLFKQSNATPKSPPTEATPKPLKSTPTSSLEFIPPQVLSRSSTAKGSPAQPMSSQKANLLAMFKSPSAPKAAEAQGIHKDSSLQAPSQPIELSAFPSPGHSRVQSETKPEPQKLHIDSQAGKKRHSPQASVRSPPTSATISGPLNIPQFDMIAKHHREAKNGKERGGVTSQESHPVTILPRPGKQNSAAAATASPSRPVSIPSGMKPVSQPIEAFRRKEKPAHPKQLLTPVKTTQPPAPTLEAQSTPPKQFHPQILKRPVHLQNETDNMSPIQPLPSPKHAILTQKAPPKLSTTSAEHKKSLLSLFSAPSPVVSPPSATLKTGNSFNSLISPLSEHRTLPSGLERQTSWKENQQFSQMEHSRSSSTAVMINDVPAGHSNEGIATDVPKEQSRNALNLTTDKGKEPEHEPEHDRPRSNKQTPDELKNLLLGRLANIIA